MEKTVYDNEEATLEERIRQNIHYVQRREGDAEANAFRKR